MKLAKVIEQLNTLSYSASCNISMTSNPSDRADYRKDVAALEAAIAILNTLKEVMK